MVVLFRAGGDVAYLNGDSEWIRPSWILMRPAAEMREPWRKDECWKTPDFLMPT